MHRCTTLALLLSVSACEHASPTPDPLPTAPAPAPAPAPAISARPAPEVKKPLPKVPCRARVCPEWNTSTPAITPPTPPAAEPAPSLQVRPYGVTRASPWPGGAPKVRVQKRPEGTP